MSAPNSLDVLIVGAGFAGLYQLYSLRKLGYNCKVVERGGGIGGVWYWNSYPGARVDTPVPTYEFGFDGLYKDFNWTERFPGRAELLKYFAHVEKKLDLTKDISLNTEVHHAEFDTKTSRWTVKFTTGGVCDCKYLVLCTGGVTKPYIPDFKDIDTYEGIIHHTGRWPQGGVDTVGKKVAVIGTGASGIQTIQEIGPHVTHLTVFQRTANLCMPMNQSKLTEEKQAAAKAEGTYDEIYKIRPNTFPGFDYGFLDELGAEKSPEERRELYEKLWAEGGFRFWLGNYKDILFNKELNDSAYTFWAEKCRARIKDPKKKDLLAPVLENQPHTFGTKRPSLEQNFFEICLQDNIDIVDTSANPIESITPTGLKTKNGDEYEFDIIVLATGFDAITGSFTSIDIVGTDGRTIADKWSNGIRTYLGMTMANFPNLFMTYGAQAPTAFGNGPVMAEIQGAYITSVIEHVESHNLSTIEATPSAEDAWVQHITDLAAPSLFLGTKSWYVGANIPGKKVEIGVYTGGVPGFVKELEKSKQEGWKNFVFDKYQIQDKL